MSFNIQRNSPSDHTTIVDSSVSEQQSQSYSHSFVKVPKALALVFVILCLAGVIAGHEIVFARQIGTGDSAVTADSGGIKGYVVGNGPVAAYTCPDTVKCAVKLNLNPGTVVLIVDNVVGGNVPGLNNTAWRKIVYQGLTLYVPQAYIKIGTPSNGPDISLVQTSFEDDSTTAPTSANGFKTAPSGNAVGTIRCTTTPCPPPTCADPGYVVAGLTVVNGILKIICCPQGYSFNRSTTPGVCVAPVAAVTRYTPTDGRINGNAGDRIAIYCRRTGRIEVWSINDSQGHFLVEFNHDAVNAAGKDGFRVTVGGQGVVTINGDGHGQYWVALYGGPFNATGTGDFAKIFNCYVK